MLKKFGEFNDKVLITTALAYIVMDIAKTFGVTDFNCCEMFDAALVTSVTLHGLSYAYNKFIDKKTD